MADDPTLDPELEQEAVLQNRLIYSGLIAVGLIMVQPFVAGSPLDLTARITVAAFAIAIPLLAALVLVNQQEAFRRRFSRSRLVTVAQSVAQGCAFAGVVAGFWHIWWVTGVITLVSGCVAVGVHSAGYISLEPALSGSSPDSPGTAPGATGDPDGPGRDH